MIRFALPEFASVTVCVFVAPMATLPKPTLAGTTESCAWVPVPVRAALSGEFGALLTSLKVPASDPAELGVHFALKVEEAPAAKVSGRVIPAAVNPAPLAVA